MPSYKTLQTISDIAKMMYIKGKDTAAPVHAMTAHGGGGVRGLTPLILNLGTKWRWVATFMFWFLEPQRNIQQYTLSRSVGGPQS
jgi:hypothetical protein